MTTLMIAAYFPKQQALEMNSLAGRIIETSRIETSQVPPVFAQLSFQDKQR